jgi:hypothetical protein
MDERKYQGAYAKQVCRKGVTKLPLGTREGAKKRKKKAQFKSPISN